MQRLRRSADADYALFLRSVVCRLASGYCKDIRVYIIRTPGFNASMAPNGAMNVWTGLLLRAQNEAQLAFVLGHEFGHYLRRHTLQQWRTVRNTADALVFVRFATAFAGVGLVGDVVQLAAVGSFFFSTHPTSEERERTLKSRAESLQDASGAHEVGAQQYLDAVRPFRAAWWHDELRSREFDRCQVVLDHLREAGDRPGELQFFQGELYRLRGQADDSEKAVAAYRKALASGDAPPETQRALGLVLWHQGQKVAARAAFEGYLDARADAPDRAMVKSYIQTAAHEYYFRRYRKPVERPLASVQTRS